MNIGGRSIKAMIVGGLLALLSVQSQAANVWFDGPLQFVYPLSDGSFVLGMTGDLPCGASGTVKYLYVTPGSNGVTVDAAKNMLAVALTAFALEKSIQVVYENASTSCYVNRFLIAR
jgi:hypothetical protein